MIPTLLFLFLLAPSLYAQAGWILEDSTWGQPFQRWEATSFIASPCDPQFDRIRDLMLDSLVRFTGVNRLRVEVRSGSENPVDHYAEWRAAGCPGGSDPAYLRWRQNRYVTVNDNDDSTINEGGFHFTELDATIENVVIPLRTRLEAKGEDLHVNLCYVAFTGQNVGGTYIHDRPHEYAEFVLAVHQHLKKKWNIVPDSWEAVLEPDLVPQWTAQKLGAALNATAITLRNNGFEPRFVAPSTTNMSNAIPWTKQIVAYPNAKAALKEMSYHRYSGTGIDVAVAIRKYADTLGIGTSMLEWWFDNATPDVLRTDLLTAGNTSWQEATISGHFDLIRNGDSVRITRKKNAILNGILTRYVKPGAVRMENSFDKIVMRNTDGSIVAFQSKNYITSLHRGWPTGHCTFVRVDSLLRENVTQWIRTKQDSNSQLDLQLRGRDRAFVFIIRPGTVGVDEHQPPTLKNIVVSPMPVKNNISITVPHEWDGLPMRMRIVDMQGRVVMSVSEGYVSVGTSGPLSIPIDLSNGLYAVECVVGGESARTVVVVER
ncbi:MAG: hypothetical protein IPF59_08260 [Ignavibacteria bacterium]|nr:hypothetical protein [Ignavibacteria bacterium]